MSGKKNRGSARAVPRAYGRLTRHERDTVQRMLERGASCREIARELGRSPSTVSAEVSSHRFVTAPKSRRGERVGAGTDLSAACPRLAAWPRCCNGCGRYRALGCKRRPHVFYDARAAQLCAGSVLVSSRRGIAAAAWEMDTVEGAREDSACLLTLLHRPSRLQLALPLGGKTAGCVAAALEGVRAVLGADGTRRVFRAVLTDNGAEFSDEAAVAALLGEGPGETRLFYCDPRRSDQKGACERNHVEIRKLLPKGAGLRFDRLSPADMASAMSHVNSEPRGALGFSTPARAFRAMLGDDAAALLDAYGVEDVPLAELDLTPGLIERARAERGDAPLA